MKFSYWLNLLENNIFQLTPYSLIIGVEHNKPISVAESDLNKIQELSKKGIYFEGNYPEEVVKNFISKYLPQTHMASWEPPKLLIPEICSVAISLFGVNTNDIIHKIKHNSKMSIRDNLLASSREWHGAVKSEVLDKILQLANLQDLANKPCSNENFYKLHQTGYQIMFDGWTCNSKNNPLQALQEKANSIRNRYLIQMMNKGGIFFVGRNHIDCIRSLLH